MAKSFQMCASSKHAVFLGLLMFCVLTICFAQEAKKPKPYAVRGYVKYLPSTSITGPPINEVFTNNLLHNRFNFQYFPHKNWTVTFHARNRLFWGEETKLNPQFAELVDQYDGLVDLSVRWVDRSSVLLHSVVDRAYVEWRHKKWEARLGRQRINWGINTVWNPNDLFNAFNYLDFDYEERPGSDAARLTYYIGPMSNLQIAVVPDTQLNRSVAAAYYGFNRWNYDWQVISGYYRGDATLGLGWAGNLKDAGFKGEVSWFIPTAQSPDSQQTVNASMAVDYLFKGVYLSAATMYNSRGATQPGTAAGGLVGTELSPKNLFPSPWSFIITASGQATPLLSISGAVIYATENHLLIASPSATYSIVTNWDLDLIAQVFFSQNPLTDDFQHQGSGVFLRLKWSY
ncbi:MAG: hypothetical protein AAGI38_08845 [Bacteroidota bacterium]